MIVIAASKAQPWRVSDHFPKVLQRRRDEQDQHLQKLETV
jgi:hypothetical protein